MYARAQNFSPELHTRIRSGYFTFVNPTHQKTTEKSDNPLLIVQSVGPPKAESKRCAILLSQKYELK